MRVLQIYLQENQKSRIFPNEIRTQNEQTNTSPASKKKRSKKMPDHSLSRIGHSAH